VPEFVYVTEEWRFFGLHAQIPGCKVEVGMESSVKRVVEQNWGGGGFELSVTYQHGFGCSGRGELVCVKEAPRRSNKEKRNGLQMAIAQKI
jgi:hypothetical protein